MTMTEAPYYGAPEAERREFVIALRRQAADHRHRANAFIAMAVLLEDDTTIDRQFRAEVISTANGMREEARKRVDKATALMGQASAYEAAASEFNDARNNP